MVNQISVAGPASPSTTKYQNSRFETPLGKPPHHKHPPTLLQEEPIAPATKFGGFLKIWEGQGARLRQSSSSTPTPPLLHTPACPAAGLNNRPFVPSPQKVHFKPLHPCLKLQVLSSQKMPPQSLPCPGSGSVTHVRVYFISCLFSRAVKHMLTSYRIQCDLNTHLKMDVYLSALLDWGL